MPKLNVYSKEQHPQGNHLHQRQGGGGLRQADTGGNEPPRQRAEPHGIGVVSQKVCNFQQNRHICKNKTKFLYNLLKIKCNSSQSQTFFLPLHPTNSQCTFLPHIAHKTKYFRRGTCRQLRLIPSPPRKRTRKPRYLTLAHAITAAI